MILLSKEKEKTVLMTMASTIVRSCKCKVKYIKYYALPIVINLSDVWGF